MNESGRFKKIRLIKKTKLILLREEINSLASYSKQHVSYRYKLIKNCNRKHLVLDRGIILKWILSRGDPVKWIGLYRGRETVMTFEHVNEFFGSVISG